MCCGVCDEIMSCEKNYRIKKKEHIQINWKIKLEKKIEG